LVLRKVSEPAVAVTAAASLRHRVGRCVRCWVSRIGVEYERGTEPCQAMRRGRRRVEGARRDL